MRPAIQDLCFFIGKVEYYEPGVCFFIGKVEYYEPGVLTAHFA